MYDITNSCALSQHPQILTKDLQVLRNEINVLNDFVDNKFPSSGSSDLKHSSETIVYRCVCVCVCVLSVVSCC
jgi:hypothetical protein